MGSTSDIYSDLVTASKLCRMISVRKLNHAEGRYGKAKLSGVHGIQISFRIITRLSIVLGLGEKAWRRDPGTNAGG
jgi:hypothetical protein